LEQREAVRRERTGRLREEMEALEKVGKEYEGVVKECWKES
jgi:hypothetical protein